jgi:hypothetical protein
MEVFDALNGFGVFLLMRFVKILRLDFELAKIRTGGQLLRHGNPLSLGAWRPHEQAERRSLWN